MSLFEKATRRALRFSYRGLLSVEDVWELPVEALDAIYTALKKAQSSRQEGLLQQKTSEDEDNELRLGIVKHVFDVKQAERLAALDRANQRRQREKILEVIANKQDSALHEKSIDELQQMLSEQELVETA